MSADILILTRVIIAYEPISATLRSDIWGKISSGSCHTIGGSVKPENAGSMLTAHGIHGALIGGASLPADQFLAIVRAGISEAQVRGKSA